MNSHLKTPGKSAPLIGSTTPNRSQAGRSLAANDQQSSTGSAQTLGWAADPLYSVCLRRTGGAFQGPLSSLIGIVLTPQSDPRQWPVHIVGQPRSTVPSHLPMFASVISWHE